MARKITKRRKTWTWNSVRNGKVVVNKGKIPSWKASYNAGKMDIGYTVKSNLISSQNEKTQRQFDVDRGKLAKAVEKESWIAENVVKPFNKKLKSNEIEKIDENIDFGAMHEMAGEIAKEHPDWDELTPYQRRLALETIEDLIYMHTAGHFGESGHPRTGFLADYGRIADAVISHAKEYKPKPQKSLVIEY